MEHGTQRQQRDSQKERQSEREMRQTQNTVRVKGEGSMKSKVRRMHTLAQSASGLHLFLASVMGGLWLSALLWCF